MMKNIKKSFNFEIEISGTDKEISELKGIGFDAEVFNENSFDDYFEIEKNQIEPNKFIFSISQKKKDKTSIKDLSSKLFDEIVSRFKCKDKLILKNRENNRGITFIDFCFDLKIFSDSNDLINKNKGKDTINDKENENQEKIHDIFETIYKKLNFSEILDKSDFNINFKLALRTDFLFKYLFEEEIEKIIKNILNFKLIANGYANTKILLIFIIDKLIEEANKRKNDNSKDLLSKIKELLFIPLKKIKYDLINNKKDIHDFVMILYKKIEKEFQKSKNFYNSKDIKDFLEETLRGGDRKFIEIFKLFYELIDFNEFCFAIGLTNNKLGFKVKTYLPENNKINFLFLLLPISLFIYHLVNFIKSLLKK